MRARRSLTVAATVLLAIALMAPSTADARNGRIAAGVIGGLAAGALIGAATGYWGPGPYYYGYPAPVYYYPPGPYYAPPYGYYGYYGCYRRTVWTGRYWRRIRICD